MYNFGSPRVGNKRFADMYNQVIVLVIVRGTYQFQSYVVNRALLFAMPSE